MALKIRLRQQGRNNLASFRLVVADERSPRDGRYVEMLGWYNPLEEKMEKQLNIEPERIQHWLDQGAQLSERAASLIARTQPQLIRKHTEKRTALRTKLREKRRARKKAA